MNDPEKPDFGACCSCAREDPEATNIVMLEQKAPVAGYGWGCVQCDLPADGAIAVLCQDCVSVGRPIRFAVNGATVDKKRVPVESLTGEHKHDMTKHPEVSDGV